MNSSSDSHKTTNFWTTVPGILTGIAAIITASAGLIAVLSQMPDVATTESEKTEETSINDIVGTNPTVTTSPIVTSPDDTPTDTGRGSNDQVSTVPLNTGDGGSSTSSGDPTIPPVTLPSLTDRTWLWEHQGKKVADVSFYQENDRYRGEARYVIPAGLKAILRAKPSSDEGYAFDWWLSNDPNGAKEPQGEAFLNFSEDGQTLSGTFSDRTKPGKIFDWSLK